MSRIACFFLIGAGNCFCAVLVPPKARQPHRPWSRHHAKREFRRFGHTSFLRIDDSTSIPFSSSRWFPESRLRSSFPTEYISNGGNLPPWRWENETKSELAVMGIWFRVVLHPHQFPRATCLAARRIYRFFQPVSTTFSYTFAASRLKWWGRRSELQTE